MARTNDTIPKARPQTGSPAHPLAEPAATVAEDVRELGHLAKAGAGQALNSVKELGSEAAGMLREHGQEAFEHGRERANQVREGFEAYASKKPFQTALIAAGIGAFVGYLLRNRS